MCINCDLPPYLREALQANQGDITHAKWPHSDAFSMVFTPFSWNNDHKAIIEAVENIRWQNRKSPRYVCHSYGLFSFISWWSWRGSNPLRFDCQSNVLPIELQPRKPKYNLAEKW